MMMTYDATVSIDSVLLGSEASDAVSPPGLLAGVGATTRPEQVFRIDCRGWTAAEVDAAAKRVCFPRTPDAVRTLVVRKLSGPRGCSCAWAPRTNTSGRGGISVFRARYP